jgi:hypothetical protein
LILFFLQNVKIFLHFEEKIKIIALNGVIENKKAGEIITSSNFNYEKREFKI